MPNIFIVEASGSGGLIHYCFHLCRALQINDSEVTLVTSNSYELRAFPHNFRVVELLRLWESRSKKIIQSPYDSSDGYLEGYDIFLSGFVLFVS